MWLIICFSTLVIHPLKEAVTMRNITAAFATLIFAAIARLANDTSKILVVAPRPSGNPLGRRLKLFVKRLQMPAMPTYLSSDIIFILKSSR